MSSARVSQIDGEQGVRRPTQKRQRNSSTGSSHQLLNSSA